jgi:hypothetical protein
VCRITDHTKGDERHAVIHCLLGGDMRFHVNGRGAGALVNEPLHRWMRDRPVRPDNWSVHGAWQRLKKARRPVRAGRQGTPCPINNLRAYDPGTGFEAGRKAAGNAKRDHAAAARTNRLLDRTRLTASFAAPKDKHAGTRSNLCFECQPDRGDDDRLLARGLTIRTIRGGRFRA